MEQGQLSDALITLNLNPNFNFAIAYRGMRSQGKYVNQGQIMKHLDILSIIIQKIINTIL